MRKTLPILALLLAGCQDLTVPNRNLPDRLRATQQPTATEAFVAGSFRTWWPGAGHDDYPSWAFSTMAHEITSGFADFGQLELSAEPRSAWNNSPLNARDNVNVSPWTNLYRTISTVNDALKATDSGLVIVNAMRTERTRAVAKFVQGISTGYLGLYFDQAIIVDEHVPLDPDRTVVLPTSPYPEVVAAGIEQLDSAIAIAGRTSFTLPEDSWLFTAMSSTELVRLANSFAARLMVYQARSRAEREAVDWSEVIERIDAGITRDFMPTAQVDILWHDWARLVARVRTASRPSDFGRPSYWLIGPADSTGGYVDWISTELNDRVAFQLETTDRRIQGPGGPASPGKYFGFNRENIFTASRGTWRFSWYYFHRYGTGSSWESGPVPSMLVAEMDLLKAEALIRLGRADEAVPLINKTRVASGELPPVTIDGPPIGQGCVPRKIDGDCGSLWDALRYEKTIEGVGVSGVTAFFDARGWQTLPVNTIIHLPIPGRELAILGLSSYTFGGPGGEGSAPEPDPEHCPVALPRCA